MTVVNGNKIAQKILNRLKERIKRQKLRPHLAVVLVGNDKPSQTYVKKKKEAAESIGVRFSLYRFPAKISTKELIGRIAYIQKQKLSGIIVQLPLPKHLDKKRVLNALRPSIDVDFLTWESLGKLMIGENALIPPSPGAILEILNFYKVSLTGKHIVLVGQGDLIGKPLTNLFIHMPVTLTACNKETRNLRSITRTADILITGVGKAGLIKADMIKKGAVVIDAGVSFVGKKITGDIDFPSVSKIAGLITPTPGGVGPVTVAKLLENTVKNSKHA